MRKFILWLVVISLVITMVSPVLAGDVDPAGTRLKGVVEDYLAKAPENDAKAQTLRSGKNQAANMSMELAKLCCGVEMISIVGAAIWLTRLEADECGTGMLHDMSISQYCIQYSTQCGHWVWDAACLKHGGCKQVSD